MSFVKLEQKLNASHSMTSSDSGSDIVEDDGDDDEDDTGKEFSTKEVKL